jgi:hypothetical protein
MIPGRIRVPRWGRISSHVAAVVAAAGCALIFLLVLLVPSAGDAGTARWTLDMSMGQPINLHGPLTITQAGQEDIDLTAEWETRPFEMPFYWDIRVTYWPSPTRGWALDFFHHKLYLKNEPPDVQHFEHTHGYNMFTIQRLWRLSGFVLSAGGGLVLTNPESTVRGYRFNAQDSFLGGTYFMSGPVATVGLGRRFYLRPRLFGALEGRFTLSHATAPVVDGESKLTHAAFHVLLGLGVDF